MARRARWLRLGARHALFGRERLAAGAPPAPLGIHMCGPALIRHGTAAQKDFFLPRMLSGQHFWCQGYSEPESGSDLASLQMRADDDGDHLVCTGSKIWNTHANVADWMFCLVRTERAARPQQGITFVDRAAGSRGDRQGKGRRISVARRCARDLVRCLRAVFCRVPKG